MKKLLSLLFIATFLLSTISSCGKDEPEDDSNKLDAPELLTPSNGQTYTGISNSINSIGFDWTAVSNATEYQVQTSPNSDFSTNVESYVSSSSEINYGINLDNSTNADITYYWRVRAIAPSFESSNYSEVYTYTVTPNTGGGGSNCDFCNKTYDGTMNGSATLGGVTEQFNNRTVSFYFQDDIVTSSVHETTIEFFLNNFGSQVLNIDGTINGNVITFTNEIWNLSGIAITVNGSGTFNSDYSQITGSFTFSGGATGTVNFFAND